ncbi:diguanylate cyclase [Geodermatophilus sp. YIM 151500]|uniref:diguanylate cyclase domain-containing protein n=1 Tax=Geodermatophilus sp. YIM 151500 TaxID=2984531 RepID=UPI0021E50A58|nr:diguanylate cyclase [Geodermatophilus sp. YIM 151500]MCV2490650.1 diguanylate cyclase [Geodermatophilus sp. YIM 151500]
MSARVRPPLVPRDVGRTVLLALLGLALTVPSSPADGTGMQWDDLVLAAAAGATARSLSARLRRMDAAAARPWRPLLVGAVLVCVAQLLTGLAPGPAMDGFAVDDVVLLTGASMPLVTCAVLARRVRRTRWAALLVDGAMVTVALVAVTEVLRTPISDPTRGADDPGALVLGYGVYAALVVGGAGVLCTVSTAALRRSATTMITAVAWQATAAVAESLAVVTSSPAWVAASGVTVVLGMQTALLAVGHAPRHGADPAAGATARVNPAGMVLVVVALLALPVALVTALLRGEPLSAGAQIGCALVLALVGARVLLRIRERGRLVDYLVRSEEDFRDLVEVSSDGIAVVDGDLAVRFASPTARELLGLPEDRAVRLTDLVRADDRAAVAAALVAGGEVHFRVAGSGREVEASASVRPGSGRHLLHLRDVTTRRRRERELERMAFTDHLTGLPNRAMLFQELAAVADDGRCLLALDLDGFKTVNDVAGHEAGDQLLVEVARRLHTVVRDDDVVARLGGDEFAVVVGGTLDESVDVAGRVVDALGLPHRAGEWTFAVGASVGVTVLRPGAGQVAFREADAALRAAKQAGKGCVRVAGDGVRGPAANGPDLATALADGTLELRYDPAEDAGGATVLVTAEPVWQHGVLGPVAASELWAAAERQGRTPDLQRWVLRTACAQVAALDDALGVVVGLAPGHWSPEGLAEEVRTALAAAGLPPGRLVLALTEEVLLTSSAALLPELVAVQRTGVRLCLDDYGMGHSLFALLARMPLDVLRVDLSALAVRDDTERGLRVLTAISRTAAEFDLVVVAGGIDTAAARSAALAAGVALVQHRTGARQLTRGAVERSLSGLPR